MYQADGNYSAHQNDGCMSNTETLLSRIRTIRHGRCGLDEQSLIPSTGISSPPHPNG